MPFAFIAVGLLAIGYGIYGYFTSQDGKEDKGEGFPINPWGPFKYFERVMIIGLPMSGKSYLAAKLTKPCPRVVYFDPAKDYAKLTGAKSITVDELFDNPAILDQKRFRIAIIPDSEPEEVLEDVTAIVRAAGNLVFVLDEVGDYNQGKAGDTLKKLARNGRHDGIVSVYVSQVAVDIPKTVRRLATRVYSFKQVHPHDLKALEEIYGEAFAQRVANLGEHEHATWKIPISGMGLAKGQTSGQSQEEKPEE